MNAYITLYLYITYIIYIQTNKHTYKHTYITLHYITLHYITLHYITLNYITLHYVHTYLRTYVHYLNNIHNIT